MAHAGKGHKQASFISVEGSLGSHRGNSQQSREMGESGHGDVKKGPGIWRRLQGGQVPEVKGEKSNCNRAIRFCSPSWFGPFLKCLTFHSMFRTFQANVKIRAGSESSHHPREHLSRERAYH